MSRKYKSIHFISFFFIQVFADGSRDARDTKELAINQKFFPINYKGFDGKLEKFKLRLNVSEQSPDGRGGVKWTHGVSELQMFINKAPENGTCWIKIKGIGSAIDPEEVTWTPTKTGRALLDEFHILCHSWVDPDGHAVNKYKFKSKKCPSFNVMMIYLSLKSVSIFPVTNFTSLPNFFF